MKKYRIYFTDGFFTPNWGKNEDEAFKKVCETFEGEKTLINCCDGGIDVDFTIHFESTEKDLKKTVEEVLEEYGRIVKVFSVWEKGDATDPILTEEDF